MFQMNYAALPAWQGIIDEMAKRSYRVREWEKLEGHLINVEKSFKLFRTILQDVVTPDDLVKQAPILAACWTPCHETDIPELDDFAKRLEHIHKPVRPDPNYPDLKALITSLVKTGNSIQRALTSGSLGVLKEKAEHFNFILRGQLANRENLMQDEVEQLCQVAYALRERVSGTT